MCKKRRAERSEELRESGGEFGVGNVSKNVGNVIFNRMIVSSKEQGGINWERLGW